MTKLSIITVNYNNAKGLTKTLESIKSLSFNPEWIIIDGGSSDESVDIIKQNESLVDYYVSEKDKGVYNAMNKGVARANGEYLLFLNSGDCFANDFYTVDIDSILDGSADIFYGDLIEEDINGYRKLTKQPERVTIDHFIGGSLSHQSLFFRRSLFDNDCYDETYKIAADHDFLIRKLYKENCTIKHFPIPVCIYESFGMSAQQYYSVTRPELRRAISQALPGGVYWYDSILFRKEMANEQLFSLYQYLANARKLQNCVFMMLQVTVGFHKWIKNIERILRGHR